MGLSPEVIPQREKTEWMYNGRYGQIEYLKSKK